MTVAVAIGSNLGDRRYNVLRAVHELGRVMSVVRVSAIHETDAVDAPPGSPRFLNLALTGWTRLTPERMMGEMLAIERRLGRVRRAEQNEPRVIDLDLVVYGGVRMRTSSLTLPHPRARGRAFVMKPLSECNMAAARFVRAVGGGAA